jgi:hypothetical protein
MNWKLLRDFGLVAFGSDAVVMFGLSRLSTRRFGPAALALIATIGDAVMPAGASIGVTAMAVGYLLSNASPS